MPAPSLGLPSAYLMLAAGSDLKGLNSTYSFDYRNLRGIRSGARRQNRQS
jgi:hypothetical protein